ncbi:MAG: DUF6677 family protein [Pirellulaceae bacterium]|nr:DUF6677 family protein [Pirellulaceae bacterium]
MPADKSALAADKPTAAKSAADKSPAEPPLVIDLRDPTIAGILAWLIPGAGHFYQRRYAKGILFLVCILGTYFFGLALGEGKVVYASWNSTEKRWQFPLQLGVGLPSAPALLQSFWVRKGNEPLWGGFMAPPRGTDELNEWHFKLNLRFELGTLYTMIAGLLNVLAIYDAACGPVISEPAGKERGPPDDPKSDDKKKKSGK